MGRSQGDRNRAAAAGKPRSPHRNPKMGTAFVHTVIDDDSRVAYAEIHDDETAVAAIGVPRRAVSWFAARGVVVESVLSDNDSARKSHRWHQVCAELGFTMKKTRRYGPRINGKITRFHRTMALDGASAPTTSPKPPDAAPCQDGSTSTTTTDPTQLSAKSHPSPD